jgi:PAS domain S-box-containing protein
MRNQKSHNKWSCSLECRITFNYIIFGLLWIFFSDKILDSLLTDTFLITKFQTYKGALFVFATAIFLYFLARKHMQNMKSAEAELRKLSQAVEQSPVGIIITNTEGIIEYVNPRATQLTGFEAEELYGKDTSIFSSGETSLKEYQFLWETIKSGKIWHGEFHNKRKNGQLYWESATISPVFDSNGNITHFLAIKEDITNRKASEIALNESEELLRKFASHLQNVREEEKLALAREIHDDLGQTLIALKIDIGMLKNHINKSDAPDKDELIKTGFGNILSLTERTIKTVRGIMNGLRPELLEINGFISAATSLLHEFEERYQIVCEFNPESINLTMDSQQSLAFFRILQESLNNVAKHAKATKVRVQIKQVSDKLVMEIIDNGTGFDINNKSRSDSYGMLGMKERAVLLGGELDITSNIGSGTNVKLSIPRSP